MNATVKRGGVFTPWIVAAAVLILLPYIFTSGSSLTMMSLMGFAIIFALSYNMLLGQTGMLSFGHLPAPMTFSAWAVMKPPRP